MLAKNYRKSDSQKYLTEISKRTSGTGIYATILSARPDLTFSQAYEALRKSQMEKDDTLQEQFLTSLKDTAPQTAIGVALNFVPIAGRPLSVAYWSAISAGGEIEEKGRFTPSNVAIDVIGDRILGNTLEGLFKAPPKSIIGAVKKAFVAEGGTEVAQDLLKFANDYRKSGDIEEKNEILNQAKNYFTSGQILVTAGVGGVVGGGIAAGGMGVQRVISQQEISEAPKTRTGEALATGQTVEAMVGEQKVVGKLQVGDVGEINVFTNDGNIHTFTQKRSGEVSEIVRVVSKPVQIQKPEKVVTQERQLTAPINLLVSHEGAPDKAQVAKVKRDIQAGKTIEPIKVIREGEKYGIEDGKHRFQAYKELGINEVPIEIVLAPKQEKTKEPVAKKEIDVEEDELIQEARKYKSAEEFVNKSGIVPEWGTINQYYRKNPYRKQLDKMVETKKYDMDILKKAERWEMRQVLKEKPAFLSENLSKEEVIKFVRENNLPFAIKDDSVIIAKDTSSLKRTLNAIDSGNQRELGLALGYRDIGVLGGGKRRAAVEELKEVYNQAVKQAKPEVKIIPIKSQLIDIWNQAQKTKPKKKTVQAPPKRKVMPSKKVTQLQETVIEKKINTIKDVKSARNVLKSIRQELENAVTEAEGRALVAQEQRAGLNVDDINQLKRIYAINKTFQEGDIETIRASKSGPLLNRVLENIQEKYPEFSEQEAFDFAINLPTKIDEKARTSEIVQLEKKEKQLRKYIDQLQKKQNELGLEESRLLEKEWESVLTAQEKLVELIRVPETMLPVGEGVERVSRLEARMKGVLGNMSREERELLGLSTYNQMNRDSQIAKVSEYVSNNPEEALKVLKGEIDPPSGMLINAIYVALKELGAVDTEIALKVASAFSTRSGQEINILSMIDKDSPVSMMEDVVRARIEGYKRKGKDATQSIKRESDKIKIRKPRSADWDSFLASIRC